MVMSATQLALQNHPERHCVRKKEDRQWKGWKDNIKQVTDLSFSWSQKAAMDPVTW